MNQSYKPYPPPVYENPPDSEENPPDSERMRSLRTLTHVLYALYAAYWLTGGLTVLIAIIINYLKRDDVAGTPYEAHFRWQIRTFWLALLGHVIGVALLWVFIGFPILFVVGIWTLYRVIKGWLFLYENKPLQPSAWV